jgi:hypothetical protein
MSDRWLLRIMTPLATIGALIATYVWLEILTH